MARKKNKKCTCPPTMCIHPRKCTENKCPKCLNNLLRYSTKAPKKRVKAY